MKKLILTMFIVTSVSAVAQECLVFAPSESSVSAKDKSGSFENFRPDGGCDVTATAARDDIQAQPRAVTRDANLCRQVERAIERAMKLDAKAGDGGQP